MTESAERRAYKGAWDKSHRAVINERRTVKRKQPHEKLLAYRRDWYKKNGDKIRRQQRVIRLKKQFGLTWEEYEAMLEAQENLCASCRGPFDRTPCVDHDHKTNAVRGLLCNSCNVAIGFAEDDPERLEAAANYLRRVRGENGSMQSVWLRDPTRQPSAVPRQA